MNNKEHYLALVGLHILIGATIFFIPFLSKAYFIITFVFFLFKIFSSKKEERVSQVLIACAYIIGAEVFFRMTHGAFLYETSKYVIILFLIIGFFFDSFKKGALPYIFYIILLIPGIIVSAIFLDIGVNFRKAIAFNLSGPVCLGISAIYCYNRKITFNSLLNILLAILLPIISTTVYLFLYSPSIKDVLKGTASNFAASGGFGPNQVATVLGLAMFAITVRIFIKPERKTIKILNLIILSLISYRAITTFSRGGVLVGIICISLFIMLYFFMTSSQQKIKLFFIVLLFVVIGNAIWIISSQQTLGLINYRYANKNSAGKAKEDITTGRKGLLEYEVEQFVKNPFLGIGVGNIKEARISETGVRVATHNEVSRILAEHGIFGATALLILIFFPLFFRMNNRKNICFYSLYAFWLFTILHSSMRIAAPAFIYGLCLLNITNEKYSLHRKQIRKS